MSTHDITIIRASGEVEKSIGKPDLAVLQAAVGGFIETVPHLVKYDGRRCLAYCNEYGKIKAMPRNEVATKLWLENLGPGPFRYDPVIHGDMVIVSRVKKT